MLTGKRLWGIEIRRRHVLGASLALAALALSLAWALLPDAGLRWGLVKSLRELGMVEVSVSDADLSLFQGNVTVRKMVARPALGSALGIKDFTLRFRWAPLLNKRVVIDRMALEGVEVHVARGPDGKGFIIDGLPMAVAAEAPAQPGDSTPWSFDVASLELANSRLVLTDGDFTAEIAVDRMTVENLNSRDPAQAVSLRLAGSLNGARLTLSGSARPFAAEPGFALDAALSGLDLKSLNPALARAGLSGLAGGMDLALILNGSSGAEGLSASGSGRLELTEAKLGAPISASAGRLALDLRKAQWFKGRLEASAALETVSLSVKAHGAAIQAGGLRLDLGRLAWGGGKLDLDGKLEAKALSGGDGQGQGAAASLSLDAERLGWDGAKLDWKGGLNLAGGKIAAAGLEIAPESLGWSGAIAVSTTGAGRAEGKLDLGPLAFKGFDLAAAIKRAGLEGWAAFGHGGKSPATGHLKLAAEGLALREPAKSMDWLAAAKLEVAALDLAADGAIKADAVLAQALSAIRRDGKGGYPWRIEARSVRLDKPALDRDGDVSLAELRLDGLNARITRAKDGFVGLPQPSPQPAGAAKSAPMDVAVGKIAIAGDSRIVFQDRTMAEPVRIEAKGVEITASDLDTALPDRDSPFDVKAQIGQASVALSGAIRPFGPALSGRLDGRIQALELPPLSPYLAEALGINLHTGQFTGGFKGGAVKGALDGRLEVELANLFIAPPDPNAPVAKKMDMPVDTVLNLLRDGDDRIRLTLPVKGDLANPDLDVSDAVAQAVAGALKSTMLTTLKLAFPLAALIEMAVDSDEKGRLTLAPLAFGPGESWLSDERRATLDAVAQLLKARPSLRLTVCGKADSIDWPVLADRRRAEDKPLLSRFEKLVGLERKPEDFGPPDRDSLARLADARAAAAKKHLVETGGIEAGRVFACRAEVEPTATKGPRVELLL